MRAVGVIPARYQATRFPGKPLTPIGGKPMVQHVWEGARTARRLDDVLVATDDPRIAQACKDFGAEVVMTRADHPTGTDRLAEVAALRDEDAIVNIQGDEPLIAGSVIDAVVEALQASGGAPMATVVHRASDDALDDPNRVKVVLDRDGFALYFSRSPIPARRPHHPAPQVPGRVRHAGANAGGAGRGARAAAGPRERLPDPLRGGRRLGEHPGGRARRRLRGGGAPRGARLRARAGPGKKTPGSRPEARCGYGVRAPGDDDAGSTPAPPRLNGVSVSGVRTPSPHSPQYCDVALDHLQSRHGVHPARPRPRIQSR